MFLLRPSMLAVFAVLSLALVTLPLTARGATPEKELEVRPEKEPKPKPLVLEKHVREGFGLDQDHDFIPGGRDNCPTVANRDQEDQDGDGVGDACDNCVSEVNPHQQDHDTDGIGNECDEDCPDPELTYRFTEELCFSHPAKKCGLFGLNCDQGFKEGQDVVDGAFYRLRYDTQNAYFAVENCHNYGKTLDFERDSGEVEWWWDGPRLGDPYPTGFSAMLQRIWRKLVDPVPDAMAATLSYNRLGGKFECEITVYGKCFRTKRVPFSYACPAE